MDKQIPAIKIYEKAGVVLVMEKAGKYGFTYANKEWSNLGQGAPEVKQIGSSPKRITDIHIEDLNQGYAPVAGLTELRENVATLYNELFRKDCVSKFSKGNVVIGGGGRLVISRTIGALNNKINLGYFVPDYASYEGILSIFNNVNPIPVFLDESKGFIIELDLLEKSIKENNIEALLLSNPSNPTGNVINPENLRRLLQLCKNENVLLIIDEFYFNYDFTGEPGSCTHSISEFIEDVNNDPVIIIAGLTKPWRYPGWRICWSIGPETAMNSISSVGSFLDGGANNPLQKAAIPLINKDNFLTETYEIQKEYKFKRDYMIKRLESMGFVINNTPGGAFYIWAKLDNLPKKINSGIVFLEECLKEKVIVVPGEYFDINPHKKRDEVKFENYVRFSYSADYNVIKSGLDAVEKVIYNNV